VALGELPCRLQPAARVHGAAEHHRVVALDRAYLLRRAHIDHDLHLQHLQQRAPLIRTCLGEFAERPELVTPEISCPVRATRALTSYLERLQERGLASAPFDAPTAAAMLLGALFADAIGRDIVPDMYAAPTEEALAHYVTLFLRGIGVETSPPRGSP
jgi:hypothetical protein